MVGFSREADRRVGLGRPKPSAEIVALQLVLDLLTSARGRAALVVAPGGYGKTSQVALWSSADGRPVAWVDLEAGHDDPRLLVDLLVRVLESVTDFDANEFTGVSAPAEHFRSLIGPALAGRLAESTRPFILVLDDVHVVENEVSINLIDALIGAVPAGSTVVLIGRSWRSASLARLRLQLGVVEIAAEQLALDVSDARVMIDRMRVTLESDQIEQLVEQTEGWPAGIRLGCFALRSATNGADDGNGDVTTLFSGRDRSVADYVRYEWLRGMAPADAEFLMRVSVLDWLSGPLCDHVLDRSDSGASLERLGSSRALVIPLDRRGQSYRMHHLLRDALDAEFERADRRGRRLLDVRASEWFERAGDIDRSVHHAVRAGDLARAERLVGSSGLWYHTNGQYMTVHRWISSLPEAYTLASAPLCLMAGVTSLGLGDGDAAAVWTRFAEQAVTRSATWVDPAIDLRIVTFRALISTGPIADSLEDVARAYRGLPSGLWHAVASMVFGGLSFAKGDVDVAVDLLNEGASEAKLVGAGTVEAICRAHLAVIAGERDDWDAAVRLAREGRQVMRDRRLEHMPTLVIVTAMSALAEALDGNPDGARAEMLVTRRNLPYFQTVSGHLNVQARLALARACMHLDDAIGARALIDGTARLLTTQPDAAKSKAQLAALEEILGTTRGSLQHSPSSLTTAELRVLHYLPTNLRLADIAERLFISRNTAKSHAASIYQKLGASSRKEAVELAFVAGLLRAGDR